jgi:hypothetical protein
MQRRIFDGYLTNSLTQEKSMPRLVGKQSNNELIAGFVLVVVIGAAAISSEYYGYTNFIPEWGKDRSVANLNVKFPLALTPPVKN